MRLCRLLCGRPPGFPGSSPTQRLHCSSLFGRWAGRAEPFRKSERQSRDFSHLRPNIWLTSSIGYARLHLEYWRGSAPGWQKQTTKAGMSFRISNLRFSCVAPSPRLPEVKGGRGKGNVGRRAAASEDEGWWGLSIRSLFCTKEPLTPGLAVPAPLGEGRYQLRSRCSDERCSITETRRRGSGGLRVSETVSGKRRLRRKP